MTVIQSMAYVVAGYAFTAVVLAVSFVIENKIPERKGEKCLNCKKQRLSG